MVAQDEELKPPATEKVVTLRYGDLVNKDLDLSNELERGLGQEGLGIIAIADIPGYPELRKRLLPLAQKLANLPKESLKNLEDTESSFNFGWSHGAEMFNGQPDFAKGSFYANVCHDNCITSEENLQRYPSQCRNNIWPREDLPELEPAFKELGSLITEVGFLLAYHCDKYETSRLPGKVGSFESTLRRSRTHKGRLLHYYPDTYGDNAQDRQELPEWCGWHTDFGSLTGLTSAMYMEGDVEVPCPDSEAGLYIRTSTGRVVKANFDGNHLAYQIGETTELLSGGLFHATPHCVKTPRKNGGGVSRNTLALFMQPSWEEVLHIPEKMRNKIKFKNNSTALTFGEYSEETIRMYLAKGIFEYSIAAEDASGS